MSDLYSNPPRMAPGTNPPRYVREQPGTGTWIGPAIAIALVAAGLGFWAMSHSSTNTTANPPAVTAAPVPVIAPPSSPEETTGRAAPLVPNPLPRQ